MAAEERIVLACERRYPVALYFFHTQTTALHVDREGTEFDTEHVARREALCTVAAMINDEPDAFWDTQPWSMQVADTTGAVLFDIEVSGKSRPTLTPGVDPRSMPTDG